MEIKDELLQISKLNRLKAGIDSIEDKKDTTS